MSRIDSRNIRDCKGRRRICVVMQGENDFSAVEVAKVRRKIWGGNPEKNKGKRKSSEGGEGENAGKTEVRSWTIGGQVIGGARKKEKISKLEVVGEKRIRF